MHIAKLVGVPNVIACALLARAPVSVSLLVHMLDLFTLFVAATNRVNRILSLVRDWLVLNSESNTLGVIRPFVGTAVTLAERFAHVRGILVLLCLLEVGSQASLVLSFDDFLDRITELSFLAVNVASGEVRFPFLQTRMNDDLARCSVI